MSFDAQINEAFNKGIEPFKKAIGVVKARGINDKTQEMAKETMKNREDEELTI